MLEEGATPPANPAESYIDRYMEKKFTEGSGKLN